MRVHGSGGYCWRSKWHDRDDAVKRSSPQKGHWIMGRSASFGTGAEEDEHATMVGLSTSTLRLKEAGRGDESTGFVSGLERDG